VDCLQTVKDRDDVFMVKNYSEIGVSIIDGQIDIFMLQSRQSLAEFDLIYLRGIAHAPLRHVVAAFAKHHNIKVVNSESFNFQCMTKLEQNVVLALNGISVPDSFYSTKLIKSDEFLQSIGFNFPLVIKAIDGKNGQNNELVKTVKELESIKFDDAIVQKFIANDFDYRAIVAGNEVILTYKRKRTSKHTHTNNIATGGTRKLVNLSVGLQQIALKSAKIIGREFTGLDILVDKNTGQYYVLEVNFNFGKPFLDDEDNRKYHRQIYDYFKKLSG
jgi:glutathione synthase/RimK-type ligase-like ATP-grasp enzyme